MKFYDTLGRAPGFYGTVFADFLARNVGTCVYNDVPVQSAVRDTCGYHVLFYLLAKCRGVAMVSLLDELRIRHPIF